MRLDDDFYKGVYTFQSIGSVAICDQIKTNGLVFDACAAPGGKTCLLAERVKTVTSCEIHEHRIKLIESYVKRMGLDNVTVVNIDSTVFNPNFKERFDAVLCDVPCSGYGTVKSNPDIKLKTVDFKALTALQLSIIKNCSLYLKRGGTLIYSTCSIFREENDDVIEQALKECDLTVEKTDSPLKNLKTKYGLQFLPNISFGAGFYLCKLKKE